MAKVNSWVKFDGVDHEYSTIPHVVEDVLDIICNIKGIIFKKHVDDDLKVSIDFKGKGAVTAKDIQHDESVEIINPDQHIAELTKSGVLKIEMNIGSGVGYSSAENHRKEDQAVNVICLDASFSPIVKVNHVVEDIRVGQELNYGKLILDVWTNGGVSAEDAVTESSKMIIELLESFEQLNQKPPEEDVQENVIDPLEQKKESAMKLSIEDLELSARSLNCLKKAGIDEVSALIEKSLSDLVKIKNFGKKSADEINDKLKQYGLSLKSDKVEAVG